MASRGLALTDDASADIDDIRSGYPVAPQKTDRLMESIESSVSQLLAHPESGVRWVMDTRKFPLREDHCLYYRVRRDGTVEVMAIIDGRADTQIQRLARAIRRGAPSRHG